MRCGCHLRSGEAGNLALPGNFVEDAHQDGGSCIESKVFKLRALRAPMYDPKRGKKCQEVCLVPGQIYTFGRSRTCDVMFLDARVSKRHCQVVLDPLTSYLHILEGAPAASLEDVEISARNLSSSCCKTSQASLPEARASSGEIEPTIINSFVKVIDDETNVCCEHSEHATVLLNEKLRRVGALLEERVEGPNLDTASVNSEIISAKNANGEPVRHERSVFRKCESLPCRSPVMTAPRKRTSLNGLYVDGQKIAPGGHCILNPGSEVSFVTCTKNGRPVNLGFGEAVGFVVEVDSSRHAARLHFQTFVAKEHGSSLQKSENSVVNSPDLINHRKRSLENLCCKQCGHKRMEDTGSKFLQFPRRNLHLRNGTVTGPVFAGNSRRLDESGNFKCSDGMVKASVQGILNEGHECSRASWTTAQASLLATGSAVSTEVVSRDDPNPSKERQRRIALKQSQRQVNNSTCEFLSALDCTRKRSAGDAASAASKCRHPLTVSILSTVEERTTDAGLEQQTSDKVLEQGGMTVTRSRTARIYADITKAVSEAMSTAALACHESEFREGIDEEKPFLFKQVQTLRNSTLEVSELMQHEAPVSIIPPSLDRGKKILEDLDLIDDTLTSRQSTCEPSSRPHPLCQDKKMGDNVLPGSHWSGDTYITSALEARSVIMHVANDVKSLVPGTEDIRKPLAGYEEGKAGSKWPAAVKVEDQARSGYETEDLESSVQNSAASESADGSYERWTGSGLYLNKLSEIESSGVRSEGRNVSLQDLLTPTHDLLGIFIATFTSDVLWFLSSHRIHPELPVTVACHESDRCWSTAEESRSSSPFPSWPNVTVVYPPFPDSSCFATSKRQGIGCHHPKIFLLPRSKSMRVIVTSANLTRVQWLHVTNNIWWQDFPRKVSCDYETLFCTELDETRWTDCQTKNDFAAHLSSFVASLVVDVPSAAHWALDLALYDFSNASASLVTSIPGLHGCPCPSVPRSIWEAVKDDVLEAKNGAPQRRRKLLCTTKSKVVGVSHRFNGSADPSGRRVRALAAILSDSSLQEGGMLTVRLNRVTDLDADPNATAVVVSTETRRAGRSMVVTKGVQNLSETYSSILIDLSENRTGLLDVDSDSNSSDPGGSSLHVGFLPRVVAKWVSPLYDSGIFTFAARIWPNQLLASANGLSTEVVQLVMYAFEGPNFSLLSSKDLSVHQKVALCSLLREMERPLGLWRLHQILSRFDWPDSAETNFLAGSSSIGTSLDAAFLASFAAAAGKKAVSAELSSESDPEWSSWTADHEANSPSIGVVFPTIERVRAAKDGPAAHQGLLCFQERTWERLKLARNFHDAVPFPPEREGVPMHVKVVQRRFQNSPEEPSYGWIYSGSHNFSPAAWGRPIAKSVHPCTCRKTCLGCALFISNYEVGLVFIEPPPRDRPIKLEFKSLKRRGNPDETIKVSDPTGKRGLDAFVLPFRVPAPKYLDIDQPATGRAIYKAVMNWRSEQLHALSSFDQDSDMDTERLRTDDPISEIEFGPDLEIATSEMMPDLEENYGETLWSEMDSHQTSQ